MKIFLVCCAMLFLFLSSCSKEKNSDRTFKLLQGEWVIKSQVDSFYSGTVGRLNFSQDIYPGSPFRKIMKFLSNGKVYVPNGIVTPTWIFQPYRDTASYYVKDNVIHTGDSLKLSDGSLIHINLTQEFIVLSVSENLLVLRYNYIYDYPNATPLTTIDSLIR